MFCPFLQPYLATACLVALLTDFCTINRVGNYLKDHRSGQNARYTVFHFAVFYPGTTLLDALFQLFDHSLLR